MIAEICRANLLAVARAYRAATGYKEKQISMKFYGNQIFLEHFRQGSKSISIDKYDEMMALFRAQWPEGEPWPKLQPITFQSEAAE